MMNQHSGEVIGQRDDLTVIDCVSCGYFHLDPLPDATALDDYYRTEFWQKTKLGALEQFEIERPWWDAIHGDWLTLVDKYSQPDELLDVGAGYGYFVQAALDRGWFVDYIEPSDDALKNIVVKGGAGVYATSWDKAEVHKKYDCISALWLIEHLPNPLEFLQWCREHLTWGGVLLAAVPHDFSAIQAQVNRIVKNKNYFLDKTHLNYFTWSSFSNLLGRAGFRIVERTTLFPMERFILDSSNYVDRPELGLKLHADVRAADLASTSADRLNHYQRMAREGLGREIVAVAVKE